MKAGVVVQIDRCVAELASQRRAVVVPAPVPLQVVHAQAVHQQQHLSAGVRDRGGQRACLQRQRDSVPAHAHADRERVLRSREIVAQHAVQRGERGFASAPCTPRAEQRIERGEQAIEQVTDKADHAADAPIDQPRDAGGAPRFRWDENAGNAGDAVVHRFDDVDHACDGIDRQSTQSTQVGRRCVEPLDHHRLQGPSCRSPGRPIRPLSPPPCAADPAAPSSSPTRPPPTA